MYESMQPIYICLLSFSYKLSWYSTKFLSSFFFLFFEKVTLFKIEINNITIHTWKSIILILILFNKNNCTFFI